MYITIVIAAIETAMGPPRMRGVHSSARTSSLYGRADMLYGTSLYGVFGSKYMAPAWGHNPFSSYTAAALVRFSSLSGGGPFLTLLCKNNAADRIHRLPPQH